MYVQCIIKCNLILEKHPYIAQTLVNRKKLDHKKVRLLIIRQEKSQAVGMLNEMLSVYDKKTTYI